MSAGEAPRRLLGRIRIAATILAVVGLAACLGAAWFWPSRFYPAYLTAYLFWVGIASGCVALLMLQYLVGGQWGLALRRPLEAGAMTLLPLALLFIPIGFGLRHLYPWADPSIVAASEHLSRKSGYLNPQAFLLRSAGYLALWVVMAWLLNRWSSQEDRTDDPGPTARLETFSGPALVVHFMTATFAMIDWAMSLEPDWASTIYGAMLIVGQGLAAFALATAVVCALVRCGPLGGTIRRDTLADLGNLLLAFIMLWAYMAFSQFLIVWSGNLTDEIPWYVRRTRGGWQWVAIVLIVLHFFAPFAVLLIHEAKRRAGVLIAIAASVVVLHFVDTCWLVLPARYEPRATRIPWDEVGLALVAAAGIGGVFAAVFSSRLANRPLYPLRGPGIEPGPDPGAHRREDRP